MRYQCDVCNTIFDEPRIQTRTERLGEWFSTSREVLCPICATPYFSEIEHCKCGGNRRVNEHMCRECRAELLTRVRTFFDEFTAEEEEQFDEWMDGDTVTNRKEWS